MIDSISVNDHTKTKSNVPFFLILFLWVPHDSIWFLKFFHDLVFRWKNKRILVGFMPLRGWAWVSQPFPSKRLNPIYFLTSHLEGWWNVRGLWCFLQAAKSCSTKSFALIFCFADHVNSSSSETFIILIIDLSTWRPRSRLKEPSHFWSFCF